MNSVAHPADKLLRKYYGDSKHPYRAFEEAVEAALTPRCVLLDAGCGRGVPVLQKYLGRASRLVGVELVEFNDVPAGIETFNADLSRVPLPDHSVDIVMSRSVFEHLTDPLAVYREMFRLLRPGGKLIFLTANLWDYATLIARLVPNRLHGRIVAAVEGRAEEDVFPTAYKTNSSADIRRLARASGFVVRDLRYLGQYPNYFMFSRALFLIGTAYDKIVTHFESLKFLRGWILVTLETPAQERDTVGTSAEATGPASGK
jgi:SAM-dependent methyltransferase